MAISVWSFILVLEASIVAVHGGQPSMEGFISIDCGNKNSFTDASTGVPYVGDEQFTDSGVDYRLAGATTSLPVQLLTLRSFPNTARSCYVLKPVAQYQKYLVRAAFYYGNYDGENSASSVKPLVFELYLNANYWQIVSVFDQYTQYNVEAVAVASDDSMSVCLVNKGSGTPFISELSLRPLQDSMYPAASIEQYLVLNDRRNLGVNSNYPPVRFPLDPYDRIWGASAYAIYWDNMSTNETINTADLFFQPPMAVLQTAAAAINSSIFYYVYWTFTDSRVPNNEFYFVFYFTELQPNTSRTFSLYLNNEPYTNVTPPYLSVVEVFNNAPLPPSDYYYWYFNSTGLSALPPFLNAFEVFAAMHLTQLATDSTDVDAINAIKEQYKVKRGWMADPCAPKQHPWDGLNCSYGTNPPRITALFLSSSGLTGNISSSFAKLTEITYLDLSYNNLTGSIPDVLGTLLSLQVLNLSGNNLTGTIPDSLLKLKSFRYDGNPNLVTGQTSHGVGTSNGSKKINTSVILIICVVPVVLMLLFALAFMVFRSGKAQGSKQPMLPVDNNMRHFTYKDLEKITNKFTTILGKGGFGTVFLGYFDDTGCQVAVKFWSQSSAQGTREFLAEAQNLSKVRHKNLVSLVGYCMDGDHLALIYEYMSQGTLQDQLKGKVRSSIALSWRQRLQIAVDAAQGLEYLHHGCHPAIIHRDVKSANILLSESLEAKISDFGMSKIFNHVNHTPISTAVVGTPGYLDPEYHSTNLLSEKSDVYSFGIVLFELITSKPPIIITGNQSVTLAHWARQMLGNGNIEDIVDSKLQRVNNKNSIWKVADVAMRCIDQNSRKRPTMTHVVTELKESLALEGVYYGSDQCQSTSNNDSNTETTPEIIHDFELEEFHGLSPAVR